MARGAGAEGAGGARGGGVSGRRLKWRGSAALDGQPAAISGRQAVLPPAQRGRITGRALHFFRRVLFVFGSEKGGWFGFSRYGCVFWFLMDSTVVRERVRFCYVDGIVIARLCYVMFYGRKKVCEFLKDVKLRNAECQILKSVFAQFIFLCAFVVNIDLI